MRRTAYMLRCLGILSFAILASTAVRAESHEHYLPLQVGNSWTYTNGVEDLTCTIIDSLESEGQTYYKFDRYFFMSFPPPPYAWIAGDASGDGFVGADDLVCILSHWGASGPDVTWYMGDIAPYGDGSNPGDDFVGADDYVDVLTYWGSSYPWPPVTMDNRWLRYDSATDKFITHNSDYWDGTPEMGSPAIRYDFSGQAWEPGGAYNPAQMTETDVVCRVSAGEFSGCLEFRYNLDPEPGRTEEYLAPNVGLVRYVQPESNGVVFELEYYTLQSSPPPEAIPDPATLGVLLVAGLALLRRRKQV